MIQLEIDAEDYELSDELKNRIEKKFGGLDEYMNSLDRGRVAVAWDGHKKEQTQINAQVWGPGHEFVVSVTEWDAEAALAKAHQKLETQIRRERDKEVDKRNHR